MSKEKPRALAQRLGLGKLEDKHLPQLEAGAENNRLLLQRIPSDLHWSEFASLQFRLRARVGRTPQ